MAGAGGGGLHHPASSQNSIRIDKYCLRVFVRKPLGGCSLIAAQGRGEGAGHPSQMLGGDTSLGQEVLRTARARRRRWGGGVPGRHESDPALQLSHLLELFRGEPGRPHHGQLEPLAPRPVEKWCELGRWVEVVAKLAGHGLGRQQSAQVLGGGGVAGELPLDPLQSVAQLPQRMAEGLGFLLGCGGLFAKAGAFVGEVSPPFSELLGCVRSGATAVGCLADTDA